MDAEKRRQIQAHARAIAALLYEGSDPEEIQTLSGIEKTVRHQLLEHVSPEVGNFYPKTDSGSQGGRKRTVKSLTRSLESERATSPEARGQSTQSMESRAGEMLFTPERQLLLRAGGSRS
uniref:hypothetical protein n=1 Tax=Baaleninema simplex TaxID=2862350 RepID=UPI0011818096